MSSSWKCPYCERDTTIHIKHRSDTTHYLNIDNKLGNIKLRSTFIVCPNDECKEVTLWVILEELDKRMNEVVRVIRNWNLLPNSPAIVLPDYIPKAIVDDYEEACLIMELSPKASATLSRRCLQGMIRDFHKISKKTLYLEIDALKELIDSDLWSAIDAIREVGNIGAHMEKDVNFIIDVSQDEAKILIGMIELLVNEWYVSRYNRQQRISNMTELGEEKSALKKSSGNRPK